MRQLVTIRTVKELIPIEGADLIELAKVDGWQCVVKKGDFKVNDSGLFFEIDSILPSDDPRFAFLEQRKFRVRTIKLRKQISQGVLLPLSKLSSEEIARMEAGESLADILRVQKYEPPMPISGEQKGTFPTHLVPKTDQERIQNIAEILENDFFADRVWEVTEKLDGTSCTFFAVLEEDGSELASRRVGACSRNWEMKLDDGNVYAQLFDRLALKAKLPLLRRNIAIQGEIIGDRIQRNHYQRDKQEFYVFDIYDIDKQEYLQPTERLALCEQMGLNHVPIIEAECHMSISLDDILAMADGISQLHTSPREGIVFKEIGGSASFKVISNKWLLKNE